MEDLKPCPFCGKEATIRITFTPSDSVWYQACCKNDCWESITDFYLTREKARKALNRMANDWERVIMK